MTVPLHAFSIDPDSVLEARLENGLTVLIRRDASAPVVAIVTFVSAGYFDETDDVVGIAHVLEHMYFKGTPTRGVGEISKQTKAVGGYLNAATIYDHTSYYTVLPSSGFANGLEIQADAYANSLIDHEELSRELEVIIQEAKRKADNPGAVATETLYEVLHDRHRIRRWRIGREPGLRALTRDHLLAFYRNFYHPSNTILSIVGDVEPGRALEQVRGRYGALGNGTPRRHPGPVEEGRPGFRYREWAGDITQTQVALGWRTPGTGDPDTPRLDLLATVLGAGRASRLFRGVRERRLASSVTAYNYTPTDLGVFVVHAESPPDRAAEAARAMWDQLRAVRDGDVGELEVERARRLYESRWIRSLEDMEGQANYLAEWQALGDWRLGERYLERLITTTRDDLIGVARTYLDPDHAAVVTYRPATAPVLAADATSFRAVLDHEPRPAALTPQQPAVAHRVGGAARPQIERTIDNVRVYRSAAGVPILVRQKRGGALVHAGAFFLGGAVVEGRDLAGLTTLLVRTAIKGTERRTALQIAEEAEMLGGSVSGTVGSESFGWSISVPRPHAAAALELLSDVAQHPIVPPEALETERAIALADIASLRDDMYRYPVRLAMQGAFPDHPYGVPVGGNEASLPRIDRDRVQAWHAAQVLAGEGLIAVVGDGDPDELAAMTAEAFDALDVNAAAVPPAPSWPVARVVAMEQRERAQSALAMLTPGPRRDDPDRFVADLIVAIASGLGGRLFDVLRDQQSLCYTVQAFAGERRLAGTFGAYIATSPEKEDAARAGLMQELGRFRTEEVTAEELNRAKEYLAGVHAIRQQSGGSVLADVIDAWLFGSLSELPDYERAIRAVSVGDIVRVAAKYLDLDRRAEGIVRGISAPTRATP